MNQKPALGKGLASLLPGASFPPSPAIEKTNPPSPANPSGFFVSEEISQDRHHAIALIDVETIKVNPFQPRREFDEVALEELTQSIRANGVVQPLVVRKDGQGYQLIAGERRLRASKRAGLKKVPVVIRRSTDRESLELAIIENIQRQDLNCVDEAVAYQRLTNEFFLTQEEIAKKVGKERSTVANLLRLLHLPEGVLDSLKEGKLSLGHAKVLLSVDDAEARLRLCNETVEKKLSVRELEALVEQIKNRLLQNQGSQAETTAQTGEPNMAELKLRLKKISDELTQYLSTKVLLHGSEHKGKIVLHYASRDELNRLLDLVQKK